MYPITTLIKQALTTHTHTIQLNQFLLKTEGQPVSEAINAECRGEQGYQAHLISFFQPCLRALAENCTSKGGWSSHNRTRAGSSSSKTCLRRCWHCRCGSFFPSLYSTVTLCSSLLSHFLFLAPVSGELNHVPRCVFGHFWTFIFQSTLLIICLFSLG